jgi:hypothetical protein
LIGEKFRAAPGIAAPVEVAALAVPPIEFIKRIAAAATTVNASLRMGSPARVGVTFGLASRVRGWRPRNQFIHFPRAPAFGFSTRLLKSFASAFEPICPIQRLTRWLWP